MSAAAGAIAAGGRPGRRSRTAPILARLSPRVLRLLKGYQDDLQVRFGERTAQGYLSQVTVLLGWLAEHHVEISDVRSEDLAAYQADLLGHLQDDGKPYAVETQRGYLGAARSFFRFLCRRSYLLHDPSSTLAMPRVDHRLPRSVLSPREVQRLLEGVKETTPAGLRDRAVLETFYATGIRVSELAHLTPYDVDTSERTLRVVLGKGRKDRNVPLTPVAAHAIEAYLSQGRRALARQGKVPYLFVSDKGGFLHRAVLNRLVRKWAKRAGIDRHVTCHTFRHSVATHLLKGRADIRHIQVLLGHARLSSTERYTRVEITDLKQVIERAHPRAR